MTTIQERNREIIRYNMIGVVINLALSAGKLIIGYLFHSHAVLLDGMNSLSDLVSEVFSIAAAKLGAKRADPEHPFGYGRLEYISSLVITMLITYVGGKSFLDSIDALLNPHEPPSYSVLVVGIMVVSLVVKLAYGILMRKRGRELGSAAMIMTGTESLGDCLVAAAVLLSCLIFRFTGIDLEHWLCILISLMIIQTGISMVRECMDKLIGKRVDPELRRALVQKVTNEEGVLNASNLAVHNYGEGVHVGSMDIEVGERTTAKEISAITRRIKRKAKELGVTVTSVGVTGVPVSSEQADEVWDEVIARVLKHKSIRRAHSFTVDFDARFIAFSVVVDSRRKTAAEDLSQLKKELQEAYPDMKIEIDIAQNS